jgi:hypothetical protein
MLVNKIDPQDILKGHGEASEYCNNLYTPKSFAKFACTKEKDIPMHKIGRKVIYLKSELDTWLTSQLNGGK